ncbi:PREDICTED: zinc transporter ZIP3-like [Priapulus caudatus]|uniref:Zinc transporter ZIP3-like n=1 Tax=Priapulus caudatus TaxID=37621 RepID=A0ABM1E643_PRICU|nr:PREDICTED: zinc transporter ZIP3-like [Priapulus caudatus]
MEVLRVKLFTAFALFVVAITCGLLPIKVMEMVGPNSAQRIVCFLNCLAGGIFLGTSLLHMLPEVREAMELAKPQHVHVASEYPLTEFVVAMGIFMVFTVEEVILAIHGRYHHGHSHGYAHAAHLKQPTETTRLLDSGAVAGTVAVATQTQSSCEEEDVPCTRCVDDPAAFAGDAYSAVVDVLPAKLEGATAAVPADELCETHARDKIRVLTLLLSLSLHTVFEGLALGLTETTTAILALFSGIVIHKSVIAFSLGVQFMATRYAPREVVGFMLTFSGMTLLGAVIGIMLTEAGNTVDAMSIAVLQGLAAGTFIYVTFFEVIGKEMTNQYPGLLKLFMMVLGFGLIAILSLFDWYQ